MVASASVDPYSPFHQHAMPAEDGPQSSEEGSGLHSPVSFGAPYATHGDSLRYSDGQHNLGAQFDFSHSLAQQPPTLSGALLDSSSRHVTYPSHYAMPPRNQLGVDFSVQPPVAHRIPAVPQHSPHIDFRYPPAPERRLPGGPSQDPYNRLAGSSSTLPMESDHRSSLVPSSSVRSDASPAAETSTSPRDSRKEISSVVIACRQCRSRKIRCDSTRPVCNNCVRRSNTCEYDTVPKRRGPDKRPGTRQRSCKKRTADGSVPPPPKRRRTTNTTERPTEQRELPPSKVKENLQHEPRRLSPTTQRHPDRHPHQQDHHYSHTSSQLPPPHTDLRMPSDQDNYKHDMSASYRRPPSYMYDQDTPHRNPIPTSPTIESEQGAWWDKIMRQYELPTIIAELTFLVNNTGHLLSFINLEYLRHRLLHDDEHQRIHPCFILSALAMAKLMKSSAVEGGNMGLQEAMLLAHDAHTAFEEAIRRNWIDHTIAEAALVLALFESSAYPNHSPGRATDALSRLDGLIRTLSLTTIDTHDHEVSLFSPNTVPMVLCDSALDDYALRERKCGCFPPDSRDPPDHYATRPYTLPWDPAWNTDEVRQEEIRRLCWASLTLVSEYVARCEAFNEEAPHFYLCDPANFGLLFPGEVIDRMSPAFRATDSLSPKESVWALYCRSMLLWNFSNRFRHPSQAEERAENAHEAFLEAQSIEDALNTHRCNLDTTLIYNTREYIHNTRMLVALAFRSFHGLENSKTAPGPVFKRKQAEDWLFYEDQVIRRVNTLVHQLGTPAAYQLTRRPYRVNWFINQLAICLVLWTHDPSLDDALKLAKSILIPIDVLNTLWPSRAIQERCDALRQQLIEACTTRHIDLPFPPSFTVPNFVRQ